MDEQAERPKEEIDSENYQERLTAPGNKDKRVRMRATLINLAALVSVPIVLLAVSYAVSLLPPPVEPSPCNGDLSGQWGPYEVISPTEVHIEFTKICPRPRPTQLTVVLNRDLTTEGAYNFLTDNDGILVLSHGVDMGTMIYEDSNDNRWVDDGDELIMTDLTPGSEYTVMMFWSPTGDQIASKDFSTPT